LADASPVKEETVSAQADLLQENKKSPVQEVIPSKPVSVANSIADSQSPKQATGHDSDSSPLVRILSSERIPLPLSLVTAAVRASNPILDELAHSLSLLTANDPSLLILDLKDCQVFQLHHGTTLAEGLKKNTHLKTLDLQNVRLQTNTAIEIANVN